MQESAEIPSLLTHLIADLQNVAVLWQIGVLALCLLGGWIVAREFTRRWTSADTKRLDGAVVMTVGGLGRVLLPLIALLLLLVGRALLHRHLPSTPLLDVAVPLLVSFCLVHGMVYLLRHAFSPSGLLRYWERAIAWTVWIGLALHITGLLHPLRALLDGATLPLGARRISLLEILGGCVSVGITVVAALWLGRLMERRLQRAQGIDASLSVVFAKLTKTVLVIVAVLVALPMVGIDLTVLSVFGGALGVGIGLGLQKIAANYISGFIILLDRSIVPGALVTIDQRYGEVTRLNARYIVLRGPDGTESIIPNEIVVSSTVVNHSYSDNIVRVDLPISVSYQSDVERALLLMRDAACAHSRIMQSPPPTALLKRFGESGVDLELYGWIRDPEAGRGNLQSELYLAIWKAFQAHAIEIPFPQREVRIVGETPPAIRPAA
ncbi:MAG: mechanosensitive ion channel [Burkholderiales bacterium]|nr:mechanosensitive ion channel [Burkholderiales bacterium]